MAESMIERVAAFLKERDENVEPHEANAEERRASAHCIVKLMREPSPAIIEAAEDIVVGYDDFAVGDGNIYLGIPGYPQKVTEVWEKLIDAALAEETKP